MPTPAATGAPLFDLIAGVDERLRALAKRLPEQTAAPEHWVGILFRVGERCLLAPLDQVAEVLEVPADLTPVPGTCDWVLGVANHRGTLLPIFDLAAFTAGAHPARRDADRVLVVRQGDLHCGLVANEVIGIRHIALAERLDAAPDGLGVLQPFVQAAFPLAGAGVPVIALDNLLGGPLRRVEAA
jgi:twitching motility protein PilI